MRSVLLNVIFPSFPRRYTMHALTCLKSCRETANFFDIFRTVDLDCERLNVAAAHPSALCCC